MLVLSADPWAPDYGMGYEAVAEEAALGAADPFVETTDWSLATAPAPRPEPAVTFVDGIRRIELRVVAEQEGLRVPGLFGSYAVGSVRCADAAAFDEHRTCRAVVLCSGLTPEPERVVVGGTAIVFEPTSALGPDPNHALLRLQELMRREEAALAARLLLRGAGPILVDGPLRLTEPGADPLVGVIKRFVRRYLEPAQEALLGRLRPGERTPLFGLLDREAELRGYSWYTRIAPIRPPWHDHAGIVRCEVRAGVRLDGAVELADRVTALLPRYAGRPSDPRTPQNLAPVAGLEGWLRHRIGDRRMIRRALLEHLASRQPAGAGGG